MAYDPRPAIERFLSRIEIEDATDPCWTWTGKAGSQGGYGFFRDRQRIYVHRWAYEFFVRQIPDGLTVEHLCHTRDMDCPGGPTCPHRRCVNPEHLTLLPIGDNVRAGGHGKRTHCLKGHPLVHQAYLGHRKCVECRNQRQREWSAAKRERLGLPTGNGTRNRSKTHCPAGHEYSPENTYVNSGRRVCRECRECRRLKRRERIDN